MAERARTLLEAVTTVAPNYALLDAARSPQILPLLKKAPGGCRSLYQGKQERELGSYAPYLVKVAPGDPWTRDLLRHGWGQSWGVFLVAPAGEEEVRLRLRRLLYVRDDRQRMLYFRFYDPRVLRAFLPACTTEQAAYFFGPIQGYLLEGDTARDLLLFRNGPDGVEKFQATITPGADPAWAHGVVYDGERP
jgi:hypothetical protein